jgi:hypothetical protein
MWSVAGPSSRNDINLGYIEPYVTYTTKTNTSLSLNAESAYDWRTDEWSFPPQFTAEQLMQFGEQYVQVGGAVRYWVDSPTDGPEGLGFRLQIRFLFPQ